MKKRLSSAELFTLADQVTALMSRGAVVTGVETALKSAFVHVLDAAKTVAFHEALEAHNARVVAAKDENVSNETTGD